MNLLTENSGIRCIKFSLIFFTVILFVTGLSLVIVGSTINEIFNEFSPFINGYYFTPSTVGVSIIVSGFLIFAIACFGCLGAIKESVSIIMTFGWLLGFSCLLQLCANLSNHIFIDEIDRAIYYNLNNSMVRYKDDVRSQLAMDNLHQELHCCGLNGPGDWTSGVYSTNNIPESCCFQFINGECANAFNAGCYGMQQSIVHNSSRILTVSAYMLAFTQVFGMAFAFYLGRMLRQQKLARDYCRWTIRNQMLSNITYDSAYIPFNPFYPEKETKDGQSKQCIVR